MAPKKTVKRKAPVATKALIKAVNPDRIGALWLRESSQGMKYFGGTVSIKGVSHKVVVFKNGFKEQEHQPDYIIYVSKPAPGAPAKGVTDDDVPF